ncbi:putative serine peptidase [Coniochaeta sp. 2T2.1]|nr:putative serine peptidase [Coniochaeta sp. 2T2.1]
MKFLSTAASLLLAGKATATVLGSLHQLVPPPLTDDREGISKRAVGTGVFQQLIDHGNPSLGTFPQRFWYSTEYYGGPGSPVVFFTPGEVAAEGYTGYLTNRTITGLFAQAIQGAVVMMEHRYWGTSSPYDTLTTKNLQYLTLQNSILDNTNFANNVKLPFDSNGTSNASKAPWVFSGGSYSGALSAWTQAKAPGTFWAYHASSAVVEAIDDFWQYFVPIQQGMPKNCSSDVQKVVDYVDGVLRLGTPKAKQALKEKFGLGGIVHDNDFAAALENGPWSWQSHDFRSGYSSFFEFCDYVENVWPGSTAQAPGAGGVGLQKALDGYAKWAQEIMLPGYCAGYGYPDWTDPLEQGCFDTYNFSSPLFRDQTLDNAIDRQWNWFLCNEPFNYWQNGAPMLVPSIVSRLVDSKYWERQCALFFPPEDGYTYGEAKGRDVQNVNAYTGGWYHTNTERLIWTNGQWDPWKDATVSSDFRLGGPLQSTPKAPVQVIPGGIHCSDMIAGNGVVNAGVQKVIDTEVAVIKGWVEDFYKKKP